MGLFPDFEMLSRLARFFVVAAIGAAAGVLVGLPLPYLTGPAILAAVIAPSGWLSEPPIWVRHICFVLIGIGMGAGVTPEALALARQWPLPLIVLAVFLLVLILAGAALLQRFFGFDRYGGRLAATPGHLSFVIAMAEELRTDTARVTIIQSLRIFYLTLLVPFAVQLSMGEELQMSAAFRAPMAPLVLVALVAISAVVGVLCVRFKLPAPLLLAGMAVSAVAHGSGLVEGGMPIEVAFPVFALMGTLIGTRFIGVTVAQILQASRASIVLTVMALALTLAAAEFVHLLTGLPLLDLLIAFAPGGIETMAALSLMLGADPALVAVHHVARLLMLSVMVPILMPRPSG